MKMVSKIHTIIKFINSNKKSQHPSLFTTIKMLPNFSANKPFPALSLPCHAIIPKTLSLNFLTAVGKIPNLAQHRSSRSQDMPPCYCEERERGCTSCFDRAPSLFFAPLSHNQDNIVCRAVEPFRRRTFPSPHRD